MATVRLKAPQGATSVFHDGEEYRVLNGHVELPEKAAGHFVASHGFRRADAADDQEPEADAETVGEVEEEDPAEFAARLSKRELVTYLRREGVAFDKDGTVGELRELVVKHLQNKD